ncbi:hypothetical protein CBR_g44561 [Chara braunii]|uniref:DDE Tnp4 domain-containing protein n=1 Tax=Chara braunii TaxID=69332 RepID=A0A388LXV6_CHABU|nr:hypothetical protein CBR_g44561 [Chara braunii]|eukprot:GBG87105.1 hypothetical protein CBR_g44561 [Chara braunii]
MVDTRSGKSTAPSEAEQARIAAVLRAKKEKKELLKQAKLTAIAEEQAAKKKKIAEEMMRLQKEKMLRIQLEEEERRRAAEEEAAAGEEEEEEEEPLERRRREERGEANGTKEEDRWREKKISEWVANLSLGEDEEAQLYVPQEEREAFARALELIEDPLERQATEDEKKLEWKLKMMREKKRRREEASRIAGKVERVRTGRQESLAQTEVSAKLDKMMGPDGGAPGPDGGAPGPCGRSEGVAGKRFAEMDGGGCGHGLRAEEMEAVAMAVSTVVLKTMNEMSSSSRDVAKQLRERRALLQSVVEAADCIVAALAAFVEKKVTHYRTPLPAEQVIAFALYKWASGETYESGTSAFGIGRAAGLQAVRDVTSALLRAYPDAIKWPVVVDLDLRILDVHVGYPGSVHDVHVLHNSQLWRRAQTGELFDAAPENLPHGVVTRGYLLGDNGYPVACPWIVQPYGGIDQGPDEERFDNGQKVARGCVERAFGRLKCMWRLFLRTHKTNLETLPQQFVAACTLRRVDLGIVGAGGGGRPQSSNVEEELLRNALRDRLALM